MSEIMRIVMVLVALALLFYVDARRITAKRREDDRGIPRMPHGKAA